MATRVWNGTDGNLTNTANWGGTNPVDADNVIFPETVLTGPSTNMDGLDTINAALIIISGARSSVGSDGFTPDIGAAGTPLKICTQKLIHRGSGTLYYEDSSSEGGGSDTGSIIVDSNNLTAAAVLDGDVLHDIDVIRGHVTLKSTIGAWTGGAVVSVGYRHMKSDDAKLVVENGAGTIPNLFMYGGKAEVDDAATNILCMGGHLTYQSNATAPTLVYIGGGAYVKWESVATFGTIYVADATLDFGSTALEKDGGTVVVGKNGVCIRDQNLVTITTQRELANGKFVHRAA